MSTGRLDDRQTGRQADGCERETRSPSRAGGTELGRLFLVGGFTRSRANPPGCPELLCSASANQPPRPHQRWMAPPPVFPTQALMSQLALWSDAAVLRVPQGEGVTLTAKTKKPGEDRGTALV